jgi:hypothetical protein
MTGFETKAAVVYPASWRTSATLTKSSPRKLSADWVTRWSEGYREVRIDATEGAV